MAGSSTGKGTIVEPGEQCSIWVSNVEHTLRIMREELDGNVHIELQILKLPKRNRQPTAEYTPVEWRFGLHNRDENQTDMSESEAAKRAVVVLFGLDEQSKWMSFCDVVVPDPKAMLKCYGLHKEVNGLEVEIKQVLAFDALFLALWMDRMMENNRRLITHKRYGMSPQMWDYFDRTFCRCSNLVRFDLCKIENQIPFDLIKSAINHVQKLENPQQLNGDDAISIGTEAEQVSYLYLERWMKEALYLERWMKEAVRIGMQEFMDISAVFYEGANANGTLPRSDHILDAAHKVVCGVDGMERTRDYSCEDYIHVPSATRLKDSGIKIEGVAGPLCSMSYNTKKKCLSLPKMRLFDSTVSVVRNMARYEEYVEGRKCMFHDYLILMLDLIETPLDLIYLTKCGVIHNGCGNKGVDMWRALDHGLCLIQSSRKHNEMKRHINARCKLRRHRFWSEFKRLFLSRPWLTLSTIAVVLVTVATLIQTYVAVISSNKMKPQFKP